MMYNVNNLCACQGPWWDLLLILQVCFKHLRKVLPEVFASVLASFIKRDAPLDIQVCSFFEFDEGPPFEDRHVFDVDR